MKREEKFEFFSAGHAEVKHEEPITDIEARQSLCLHTKLSK